MRWLLALFLLLAAYPAQAGIVTGIVDGNTLQIDLTTKIRIANILAPPSTAQALREVLLNQLVTISNSHTDARGVTSATITRADGTDVASQLVGHGLARAYPLPGQDSQALVTLLAMENEARTRKAGLWNDATFAVQTPETVETLLNSYGIIEGTVVTAAAVKGRYYLNFGPDWKTDFTAQLTKEAVTALALPPFTTDWSKLGGQRVRVRGWVEPRNGAMIMISSPAQLENRQMSAQKELKIWALYDAGLAAFNTLVMTFIFAVYVTHTLAPDPAIGTAQWGAMLTFAGLAVLLLSPVAGIITQRAPAGFLRVLTALVMLGTGLLFFAVPGTPLWLALLCAGLATVAYELTFIPYSARLSQLAVPQSIARWSGYGWAAGYAGGIVVLGLALWLLVGEQSPLAKILGTEQSLNIRASALLAVGWIGIFCLPLLLRPAPAAPIAKEHGFLAAWRACAQQPGLLRFIVASALYRDGLATIFGFGGIYAASVHGFAFKDILIFGIALNLGSGIGAFLFARLDQKFAPLTVIRISLIGLTVSGALVLLAPTTPLFWAAAILLSLWFGPAQAAGRAHLLIEAGIEHAAPALSLYTVTGRAANFIGPALYGAAVAATGLQQAGMGSVLLLFIAAACVLGLSPGKPRPMTAA